MTKKSPCRGTLPSISQPASHPWPPPYRRRFSFDPDVLDEPADVPAEVVAGHEVHEEVDGEVEIVEELAQLLGDLEVQPLLFRPESPGCLLQDEPVEAGSVAGQIKHQEHAGHPHEHLGGAYLGQAQCLAGRMEP